MSLASGFAPPPASEIAERVDALFIAEALISALVVGGVLMLLVFFAVRYHEGRSPDRSSPPRGRKARRAEVLWTLTPLAIFLALFAWGADIYLDLGRDVRDALEIKVTARQWSWRFEHPDGQTEVDELHVPAGRPVRLSMISEDVIHSLFVPALRAKQDVLPRRYTHLRFQARQPDEHPVFCAEFCGTGHSQMRARVVVLEPGGYGQWLQDNAPAEAETRSGEALFRRLGCPDCHDPDSGVRAPSLAGVHGREVRLADGTTVTADDTYLRESVLRPASQVVAGYDPIMPSFKGQIDEAGLMRLVEYLKGLEGGEARR
jgi:cytochrome c oxidase subunit 2